MAGCRLPGHVSDDGIHSIDDYLSEDWLDALAGEVVGKIEAYLGKHAAFDSFLEEHDD